MKQALTALLNTALLICFLILCCYVGDNYPYHFFAILFFGVIAWIGVFKALAKVKSGVYVLKDNEWVEVEVD